MTPAFRLLVAACAAALAVALGLPALAAAQPITSSGPLSTITTGDDLSCQVQVNGDEAPSFSSGECGTWLALSDGVDDPDLFGPANGPTVNSDFVPIDQTLTGNGTMASPYTLTTDVYANDASIDPPFNTELVQLTEVDTYVTGQDYYSTTITITNETFESAVRPRTGPRPRQLSFTGMLYHAGGCAPYNTSSSFGVLFGTAPACALTANNSPPAGGIQLTPDSPGPSWVEGAYSTVTADMTAAGPAFPDTIAAGSTSSAGLGIALPFSLPATTGGTTSVSFETNVSPPPPTSSTTVTTGSCAASAELPVQVTAPGGGPAVLYTVDGGAQQTIQANASGLAEVPVPAGQHTITFWGEDQFGDQEATTHTVTVVNGMPTVVVTDNQGVSTYLVGAPASAAVTATGGGLTSDPSNPDVPLSTTSSGTFTLTETAINACGSSSGSLTYTVIPLPTSSTTATGSCAGTSELPVQVPVADEPKAVLYTLDGGAQQSAATNTSGLAEVPIPVGQHTVSFWAQDQIGAQESTHHTLTVTNETTPTVSITDGQDTTGYVIGAPASAVVTATGGALTSDPATPDLPLSTAAPGTFTVTRTATNGCGSGSGALTYTVLPNPVYAQTFNIVRVTGTVYVDIPPGAGAGDRAVSAIPRGVFIPLRSAAEIPTGSIVDADRAVARLFTAVPRGPVQTGDFTGLFQARQEVSLGALTEINLINNGGPKACTTRASDRRATPHTTTKPKKLSRKVIGLLTSTVHGAFRTQGQYSAATVRGTSWTVTNQCNGTRTKVKEGSVVVENLHNHNKWIVKGHHSRFVPAPAGASVPRPPRLPSVPSPGSTALPPLTTEKAPTQAAPGAPPALPSTLPSLASGFAPAAGGETRITQFGVVNALPGTNMSLTCASPHVGACPFRHTGAGLTAGGSYDLVGAFGDLPLPAGTKVTLVVSVPPAFERTYVYTLRAGKWPLLTRSCTNAGAPLAC